MVPVTADHCREVFFYPFIKESCIAVLLLGNGPGVREFIHYKEAHTVTHVKEFRCRRIMAHADGIAAHLL